jgi:hypothetical protein
MTNADTLRPPTKEEQRGTTFCDCILDQGVDCPFGGRPPLWDTKKELPTCVYAKDSNEIPHPG